MTRIEVAWNPEFLREAYAVQDTLRPDRLVFGTHSAKALDLLEEIYSIPLTENTPVVRCDIATAELIKVAANSFLATKISFINAMAQMCEAAGGDVTLLADAIGYDRRIGREFLNAGLGFGGGCLPKDIQALAVRADELGVHVLSDLIRSVEAINDGQRAGIADLAIDQAGGDVKGKRIAVLGAAFKPGTNDTRNSPALTVADRLHAAGADVRIYDPQARLPPREGFTQVAVGRPGPARRRHRAAPDRVAGVSPARSGEARRAGQDQDHHRRPAEARRPQLAPCRLEGRPDRPRHHPLRLSRPTCQTLSSL